MKQGVSKEKAKLICHNKFYREERRKDFHGRLCAIEERRKK